MAGPAGGRRSSHGIDRSVLEAGVGNVGAVLEAGAPAAGGGTEDGRHTAPVPGQEQSRAARAQERFPRCRKDGQATGGAGTGFEFRAGSGAAAVANGDEAKVPIDAHQGEFSEPTGVSVGTGAPQAIEFCVGSSGPQCAAHVAGTGGRRDRPGRAGGYGRLPAAGHAGAIARRTGRLHATEWSIPAAAEDGAGGVGVDRDAHRATGAGSHGTNAGASGRSAARGGSARIRGGFGGADDRRSRSRGSEFRYGEGTILVGGGVSGQPRERRGVAKYAFSEGQSPHAAASDSSGPIGGQGQRKHIRNDISSANAATGIPAGHLGHRPSTLQTALADSPQGGPLRGTGSGGGCQVEAPPRHANDQGTPKARLSRRRRSTSGGDPGMSAWGFSTQSRVCGAFLPSAPKRLSPRSGKEAVALLHGHRHAAGAGEIADFQYDRQGKGGRKSSGDYHVDLG